VQQVSSVPDPKAETPAGDPSAFIRARDCRNRHVTTPKQLRTLLDKMSNDERGIRREHRGQHLYVHAGDWHRWTAEQERQEAEALDRSVPEVERAIEEFRAKKAARGARKK
jgi:hypothetical protein